MVERVVDFSNSTDSYQRGRDQEVVRSAANAIIQEDCVGASPEMNRLQSFALTLSVHFDALEDYGKKNITLAPIYLVSAFSMDHSDTAECRCYARQQALRDIFAEMNGVFSTYGTEQHVTITSQEERFAHAWLKILDSYLFDIADFHLRSLEQPTGADVSAAFKIVNMQLWKHCGYEIYDIISFPDGGCRYTKL